MFYTMSDKPRFGVKDVGFIYHFNYKDVHYYEDGVIVPLGQQPTGLEPFYPTDVDAAALLKEFRAWCKEFQQPENVGLVEALETVNYFRDKKLKELSNIAAQLESTLNKSIYFTSSLGFRCNGDRRTKSNLQDLIAYYPDDVIEYRDYDNKVQELTKAQLGILEKELAANTQALYEQKWDKQAQLHAAITIDTVNAVELNFEMLDFTKIKPFARG